MRTMLSLTVLQFFRFTEKQRVRLSEKEAPIFFFNEERGFFEELTWQGRGRRERQGECLSAFPVSVFHSPRAPSCFRFIRLKKDRSLAKHFHVISSSSRVFGKFAKHLHTIASLGRLGRVSCPCTSKYLHASAIGDEDRKS